ncbi:hypothetical protein LGH83_00755 [Lichenihabitans sp. PAMC28606]|uniref:hypothetical protein n=1 Tax=Lichenihabitans sp. PAMC28606 TaxID=2880932 RepID=UPI001D0AB9C9|nr:hypothetical protein [Lichenihabitans sp. PAMC28606]UDL94846.1 hypothetical protein LGH83_00755 [Lichenihabitans sp. PAMC28606]
MGRGMPSGSPTTKVPTVPTPSASDVTPEETQADSPNAAMLHKTLAFTAFTITSSVPPSIENDTSAALAHKKAPASHPLDVYGVQLWPK